MEKNNNLERFYRDHNRDYELALSEIRQGCKDGYWTWYIFPMLKGIGTSWMSNFYGLADAAEAIAYLEDECLGSHLVEAARELMQLHGLKIEEIMGAADSMKLHASMTLFKEVSDGENRELFSNVLKKYFGSSEDSRTVALLRSQNRMS